VVVTDFNNDGKLDFAVANQISSGIVRVFLDNGRGQFESATAFSTNASYCVVIAAGDFNGDGSPDIAALNNCNSLERWAIVAADFSGDGKRDLAVSENNAGVGLALNDGSGAPNDFRLYAAGASRGLGCWRFQIRERPRSRGREWR